MKKTMIMLMAMMMLLCSCGTKIEGEFTDGESDEAVAEFERVANVETEEIERFLAPFEFNKPFKSVEVWIETYDHGELIDTIDIFSGPIENAPKGTEGFVAMYFDNNDGDVTMIDFLAHLDADTEALISADDIAVSELWGGKELQMFQATHQPEDGDEIIAGEPQLISFAGFKEAGEDVDAIIDFTGEGENVAEMIQMSYILTLNCQFEF